MKQGDEIVHNLRVLEAIHEAIRSDVKLILYMDPNVEKATRRKGGALEESDVAP